MPVSDSEFFPRQLEAVEAPIGPILVLAGPGAGKTRCLTGRIGHLIARHGVDPGRICAITFTNKAAQEIVSRLRAQHGTLVEELTLGTIHSLCMKILRPHARHVGLVAGFGIADDDARNLILKRLGAMRKQWSGLLASFSKRRFGLVTLTDGDERLFRRYAEELRAGRLIDFDEILILTRKLFDGIGSIAKSIRARWDHVLVDECQDLNSTQYEIISRLAAGHRSLFFVGDDEQSIFSWCGADPRILRTYLSDFGIAAPIMLDRNCRSTRAIFETARRILPRRRSSRAGRSKRLGNRRSQWRPSDTPIRCPSSAGSSSTCWRIAALTAARSATTRCCFGLMRAANNWRRP